MFRKSLLRLYFCAAILFLLPAMLHAQSTQGSILGTVKDSSDAVVPGAQIDVTSLTEGTTRHTVSDASGNYQVIDLSPGHYKVSITATNFQGVILNDLSLTSRQKLRADATLKIGSVSQQVQVNASAAGAIATDTPSISSAYGATDVANLPANYRASQNGTSPLSLIQTLPGVQSDTGKNSGTGVQFSVQGGLPSQADVTVDGVTTQNTTSNQPLQNAFPSGESISELRVDGVLNNAEFGQPGEVTSISKSGTNTLHGAAFWYHQNSAFNATPFGALTKPHIVGNDFGGTVGGPVVIPHLYNGHDKSFFFGTYEGFRLPSATPAQYSVPTAQMKAGNFSQVAGVTPLTNPFTGGIYPNYTVPISTPASKFLQFFPDPNTGNTSAYTPGEINYIVNQNTAYNSNQFDVRGDQYFGQKALVFARFTWKNINQAQPEPLAVPEGNAIGQDRIFVIAANYNFSANLLNEFRFGFTLDTTGTTNGFNGTGFATSTGLQGLQNLFYNGISELDFNYLSSLNADRLASTTKSRTFQYTDNLSWSKGNHSFKFGLDIRHIEAITPLGFFGADNYGTFAFNQKPNFTGQEFGDFLIGTPQATAYDVVTADNDGITQHYSVYAQDDWKATPRLTLSYGIRYELQPGYYDPSGNIGNFDPSIPLSGRVVYPDGSEKNLSRGYLASFNGCPVGQSTGNPDANGAPCTPVVNNSTAGLPSGLKTVPTKRFMPRFGFAFRPFNDDRTAIRGGIGLYNITSLGASFYSLTGTLQSGTTQYANSQTATGPAYSWPQIYAGQGTSSAAGAFGTAYFGTANDVHWKDPYSEQWSLSVDHEFGSGYGARISYIGMETHHLVWAPNLNDLPYSSTVSAFNQPLSARPFPNWGTINTRSTGADASYHSMQVEMSHHYGNGLTFDSNYTLAKNLADNQGPSNIGFAGEVGGSRSSYGRDPSVDFGQVYGTRRHRWNNTFVYELPVGRGRKFGSGMNRLTDELVGGWQLSGVFLLESGPYLSAYFPGGQGDPSGTGSGLSKSAVGGSYPGRAQKPDRVGPTRPHGQNRYNWVNKASFICPGQPNYQPGTACTTGDGQPGNPYANPIGRFGTAQIGSIEGPGMVNLSSGLSKIFAITERVHLRAEGTFTNVLNHTNLADPIMDVSSPQFGTITSARGSDFGGSRTGQVSMRLEF
ncbi:MAG: TonB-dependent receptor [Acidobacteria bacterium]|nr:TonB-dependent receptor [Acidobacteriota bacterium]MBW4045311.1 TonB-dependent receptor [Acidobacteriota bacterium]